jgi:hypothetical protein
MSKTKRFCIESNEPHGTTFESAKELGLAGAHNKKRASRFSIETDEPEGITFPHAGSHIDLPNADRAPKESKTESTSSGQGEYNPARSGPQNFGGSVGVGTSAPKRGSMKPMRSFGK